MGEPQGVNLRCEVAHLGRTVTEDSVEIAVQVNGKTRSKVHVPRDADEETVTAAVLEDPVSRRFIDGKQIRKRILVPNRLANLVVG